MTGQQSEEQTEHTSEQAGYGPRDDGHDYVDRDAIDFDPADGLYSGTAVNGSSDIPGPHADADSGELNLPPDAAAEGQQQQQPDQQTEAIGRHALPE